MFNASQINAAAAEAHRQDLLTEPRTYRSSRYFQPSGDSGRRTATGIGNRIHSLFSPKVPAVQ